MREWLIARPVAHRGLHNAAAGIIENTPSAFAAAVAATYAIECDIQISADGEAMVFHDQTLDRLTERSGRLDSLRAAELKRAAFRGSNDHMISLGELCDLVAGRTAVFVEVKSRFDGDLRLVTRAAEVLARYSGHVALMSFDPAPIAALRRLAPRLPRGVVAERRYGHSEGAPLMTRAKQSLAYIRHVLQSRPHFIAHSVNDLRSPIPWLARNVLRMPLLTWTVRTDSECVCAQRYADQMIFEGFRP